MKILVVQLLRLGDLIMVTPVLRGLREKYPHAQIDLLLNKQFSSIEKLIPWVDHFIHFDRKMIQTALGDPKKTYLESYDRIDTLLQQLNEQEYNEVINLTQNKLSAYLIGGIKAQHRVGMWCDDQRRILIESSWFRHLNYDESLQDSEHFHYVDIFKASAGFQTSWLGLSLAEVESAKTQVMDFLTNHNLLKKRKIIIQALTSDKKKNWNLNSYKSLIDQLQSQLDNTEFIIVGAENEAEILRKTFRDCPKTHIYICELDQAYSLLKLSDFLITGDTSIKHMGAAARIPMLEISLGSSDLNRTGAYLHRACIVQSRESCCPCEHTKACHRERHFCSEIIPVDAIQMIVQDLVQNSGIQLKQIAEEYSDQIQIYRVDLHEVGIWTAIPQYIEFTEENVTKWIDKYITKIILDHNNESLLGSESLRVSKQLKQTFAEANTQDWKYLLKDLEKRILEMEKVFSGYEKQFYEFSLSRVETDQLDAFIYLLLGLYNHTKIAPVLSRYKHELEGLLDSRYPVFFRLRQIQNSLKIMKKRIAIEIKLIRALQNQMEGENVSTR